VWRGGGLAPKKFYFSSHVSRIILKRGEGGLPKSYFGWGDYTVSPKLPVSQILFYEG
jgi:hypothetical protein